MRIVIYASFSQAKRSEEREPNDTIKYLLTNLDEDIANGEELEDVRYWTTEIRKELGLNQPII